MTSLQGKLFSEYTTLEPLTVETTCAIFQDSNFYEKALLELKVAGFTEHFLCARNGDRQWELERNGEDWILKQRRMTKLGAGPSAGSLPLQGP